MLWGDLVIDLDTLFLSLSGQPMYDKPQELLWLVLDTKAALIERITRPNSLRHAWLITGGATRAERDDYSQRGAIVVVLDQVPAVESLRRIAQDPRRADRWQDWQELIAKWWRDYER